MDYAYRPSRVRWMRAYVGEGGMWNVEDYRTWMDRTYRRARMGKMQGPIDEATLSPARGGTDCRT